jgi:hypothetical protein
MWLCVGETGDGSSANRNEPSAFIKELMTV